MCIVQLVILFHVDLFIQLSVIGDDLNVSQMQPSPSRQTRKVSKCWTHSKFIINNNFPENDIAIIIVDKPFEETETFEPTKLKISPAPPVDNERCRIGKLIIAFSFDQEITELSNCGHSVGPHSRLGCLRYYRS